VRVTGLELSGCVLELLVSRADMAVFGPYVIELALQFLDEFAIARAIGAKLAQLTLDFLERLRVAPPVLGTRWSCRRCGDHR